MSLLSLRGACRVLAIVVGAELSVGVVACGSEGNSQSSESANDSSREWVETVTKTDFGEVRLSARPERIVALNPAAADIVISLGYDPMAINLMEQVSAPWLTNVATDGQIKNDLIDLSAVANVEKIAKLNPDLIVGGRDNIPDEQVWGRLSDIAPTVPIGSSVSKNTDDTVKYFASLLNEQDRAENIISDTHEVLRKAGESSGLSGRTFSYIYPRGDKYTIMGGELFELLGMEESQVQALRGDGTTQLSREEGGRIDGDVIFIFDSSVSFNSSANQSLGGSIR